MRNFKIFVLVVVGVLVTNSCFNDDGVTNTNPDSDEVTLKFGRYYGKCIGNACVEVFLLQGDILKEDTTDQLPIKGEFYDGDFVDFKGSSTIKIDGILSDFPESLLSNKAVFNTIGQPNASDLGAIYLEYQDINIHKQFLVDLNTRNIPKELISYINDIDETIDHIGDINNQN